MFDYPYHVTRSCVLPDNGDGEDNEACSDLPYAQSTRAGGGVTLKGVMDARNNLLDSSCEASHGVGAPPCYDKLHVLLHHVTTPFFVVADQEDSAVSELSPAYAEVTTYKFGSLGEWRTRILDQANDINELWATASREEGPGAPGGAALLLRKERRTNQAPSVANHTHIGNDGRFESRMSQCDVDGNLLVSAKMSTTLQAWIDGTLPVLLIAEDATTWGGVGNYFVTGATCRAPE